jgi:hypothetical protein
MDRCGISSLAGRLAFDALAFGSLRLNQGLGGQPMPLRLAFRVPFLEPQKIGELADPVITVSHGFLRVFSWPYALRSAYEWPLPFSLQLIGSPPIVRPMRRRLCGRLYGRRDGLSTYRGPIRQPAFRRRRPY